MRVLTVIDSLTWGGAEMLLGDLAQALPGAGVQMSVAYLHEIDGSPAAAALRARGVEPVHVPITLLHDPRGWLNVRTHLRRQRPDVVHTHLTYADLLGVSAARSLGLPAISTLHVMEWPRAGTEAAKARLAAAVRRLGARRVVAVSDAGRRAYLQRGFDRPAHVVTVHNGVAREAAPGAGPGVRAQLGLGEQDLVVTMVTVLREGKGHDIAAAAVARLRERHPGLRLLVLGEGPARPAIASALAPLGDAALMAGHREDVMAVLDATDVLLHPTRVDAFPTALLEAMAAGVPAVATAVGGIPEIVQDGETGVLVPAPPTAEGLVAALDPLLASQARRRELGEAGRRRFESEFAAAVWAGRLRGLYEQVAGGS